MKKLISAFLLALVPVVGFASGDGVHLDEANIDLTDQAAMQRGAKYFVNYCQGCHSAKYVRYERVAEVAGLTVDEVKDNLMFVGDKIGDQMKTNMDPVDAEKWFGAAVPDLTLASRVRGGADWIYTYLRSFYIDPARPTGVNNMVFPDVGMPHVLWELQGLQKAVFEEHTDEEGNVHKTFVGLEQVTPGKLSAEEYDQVARDLATFLAWTAEPMKTERQTLGIYVMIFLVILFVLSYLLKKEYWKDIH